MYMQLAQDRASSEHSVFDELERAWSHVTLIAVSEVGQVGITDSLCSPAEVTSLSKLA